MRKKSAYSIVLFAFILMYASCKKETTFIPGVVPVNPFDTVSYPPPPSVIPIDSNSFLGLHQYIFSTTCAVPGCHDGTFEPDFRTVQSAYNTLVYHRVEKNNSTNDFTYRVVPGNAQMSWLHERITTTDQVLGRMPLYDSLSKKEIERITNWINEGAEDLFGNSPIKPSHLPSVFGLLAFENDTGGMRLDAGRTNILDPIELPKNSVVDVWLGLYDQDENGSPVPASDFTYNKYKISSHLYEFESKPEKSLLVQPKANPFFYGPPGNKAPYYHHFVINTGDFNLNQTQYFRVYVQDKDHSTPTEIPSDGSQLYLLTFFSFVVK
ncbi:MAG TPA: hypothetical protein DCX54_04980 [Flavobacteriales bacterium]|nr:hypothetical protein [Flavobacteriales bacterium]